ncbi:DUF3105 domain-containing protein [Nocardiopsis lambiniae]|uniref:DUF3105 domain-containing protein n=1 Tax=Nocardiopsis lambiniae TaxID=3075539 RepID=A0ABU2M5A7_9ACTN|nr:DUF3105 domain-containing protein [Nocardiopsis sp. DSM 44743]MDT0327826.1 DUF3105 domain-containing protein [Nocardiopsis sp. DSM 44743]
MAKKKTAEERRQRAAALKAERLRKERRRKILGITGVITAIVVVVGLIGFLFYMDYRSRQIPGLAEYEVASYVHVDTGEKVDYEQSPPVGGDHWSAWQNCGVYPAPVTSEFAVHSLEHGAVWIAYDPELPAEQVAQLDQLYTQGSYLLVSPYEGEMDTPIVASAWGRQLAVESPEDENLQRFVRAFEQSTDVPEPGAACSQGVSETAEEVEALVSSGEEDIAQEMDGPAEGDEEGDAPESDAPQDEESPEDTE